MYIDETITITKTKDHYRVTLKNTQADQRNSKVTLSDLDTTFSKSLINFSRFYQNVMRNHKNQAKPDSLSFGTINNLSIRRGFYPINLSGISFEDMRGYITLINTIHRNQGN